MLRVLTSRAVLARSASRSFATTTPSAHTPLSALSTTPEFFNSVREGTIPAFRLLGPDGLLTEEAAAREWVERAKQVDGDKLKRMLEVMTMMPILASGVLAPRICPSLQTLICCPSWNRIKSCIRRKDRAAFRFT